MARPSTTIDGLRKAAILLVQLGRDRAALVLSRLPESTVEELTAEIVRLRDVSASDAETVILQAHEELATKNATTRGGMELARQLLSAGLGAERADEIMSRLGATLADMPFEGLRRADARQLLSFLAEEHPQTVALVLAHLGCELRGDRETHPLPQLHECLPEVRSLQARHLHHHNAGHAAGEHVQLALHPVAAVIGHCLGEGGDETGPFVAKDRQYELLHTGSVGAPPCTGTRWRVRPRRNQPTPSGMRLPLTLLPAIGRRQHPHR